MTRRRFAVGLHRVARIEPCPIGKDQQASILLRDIATFGGFDYEVIAARPCALLAQPAITPGSGTESIANDDIRRQALSHDHFTVRQVVLLNLSAYLLRRNLELAPTPFQPLT